MAIPSLSVCRLFLGLGTALLVSAESTPPKPIKTIAPAYPTELLSDPMSGQAVIQFVVNTDGRVEQMTVKSADHEAFGVAAMEALADWEFEPATKDGVPIDRKVALPMQFKPNTVDIVNRALGRTVFAQFDEEPIPLSSLKQRPRPQVRRKPVYPQSKIGSGEEMRIRVRFLIGKDGATYNPEILDDVDREWKVSAMATVAAMRFEPMKYKGELVIVQVPGFPVLITENPPEPAAGGRGGRGGRGGQGGGGGGGGAER